MPFCMHLQKMAQGVPRPRIFDGRRDRLGETPWRRDLRWLCTVVVPGYIIYFFAFQTPVRVIERTKSKLEYCGLSVWAERERSGKRSGAKNGAEWAENRLEGSGAASGVQKIKWSVSGRSSERDLRKRSWAIWGKCCRSAPLTCSDCGVTWLQKRFAMGARHYSSEAHNHKQGPNPESTVYHQFSTLTIADPHFQTDSTLASAGIK